MKLYSGALSLFSSKVRIALAEKGIEHERIEVPFNRKTGYDPKHPEVLRHNPRAQVPVLVDGDLVLYDSTVIVEYLEDLRPDPPLFPREARSRARCRMLELRSDEIFFPHVLTLIREVFYTAEAERDTDRIAEARLRIEKLYAELDVELGGRDFLVGGFSAADVATFLTTLFASQLGVAPSPELRNLGSWLARSGERPALRAEVAEITAFAARLP